MHRIDHLEISDEEDDGKLLMNAKANLFSLVQTGAASVFRTLLDPLLRFVLFWNKYIYIHTYTAYTYKICIYGIYTIYIGISHKLYCIKKKNESTKLVYYLCNLMSM